MLLQKLLTHWICCWVLRCLLTSQVISVAFYIKREKSYKFCSQALISASGSSTCADLRHGTNGFISFPKEVILRIFTLWSTGAQQWHIVSLVGDVTSPTTAVHYVWFMCSEHREALLGAQTVHGVRKQCKGEVHSSPLIWLGGFVTSQQWMGELEAFPLSIVICAPMLWRNPSTPAGFELANLGSSGNHLK